MFTTDREPMTERFRVRADGGPFGPVLATALAIGEEHARYRDTDPTATRHTEFLARFGFERAPSDGSDSV